MLAPRVKAAVLEQDGLSGVLAHEIGQRLARRVFDRELIKNIVEQTLVSAPILVEEASSDLSAVVAHDPATKGLLPPLLNFKGYLALQAYRVSNRLWKTGRRDAALWLQSECSDALQVSVHPSATIGRSVFLDHATGIVIGACAEIGDGATILQSVTIGRNEDLSGRAPKIGRAVLLSTGATLLGDVSIGDFAKIGAGALVRTDVAAGCTAVGVPARLTNCPERERSA